MKRSWLFLCVFAMLLSILSACAPSRSHNETSGSSENPQTSQPVLTEPSTQETEPTQPVTETTLPVEEEPLFTFDVYLLSGETMETLSAGECALYRKMVDAVLSHSGVVTGFESYEEFEKLWHILIMECIPAKSMIATFRNSETPFVYQDGTATLEFIADKRTCDGNYAALEWIVNRALSLIERDDDEWERIAKLYFFVTEHMDYGNVHTECGVEPNLYNSIVYGLGICGDYANYLNMLASQIGFETIQASSLGSNTAAGIDHGWSMIRVEGKWYHFDACWDAGTRALRYFAISTEERYNSLLLLNTTGLPCEVELFSKNQHTAERSELPLCENGISRREREELWQSVLAEYLEAMNRMEEA